MEKRVLMVATVPSMIGQFNMNNIEILQDLGYKVDVACDFTDESVWPKSKTEQFKQTLSKKNIECFQLDFSRNPLDFIRHFISYQQTLDLLSRKKYAFIHTHTPIASAIVRLAAKKTNTKVIYTAHGFHFYNGAPAKNWIIFYPIEKYLSRYTDVLITINKEDYNRAVKKFHAKKTEYVPGIGVDIKKFKDKNTGNQIRKELSIIKDKLMLLSVGELNENKNHETVIKALSKLKSKDYVYVIVGQGKLKDYLIKLADELNVDVRMVGYRQDVIDFYDAADVFVFPSYREGLSVALMEAMASSLPIVCSNIRGNRDLIDEKGGIVFDPASITDATTALSKIMSNPNLCLLGAYNFEKIKKFDLSNVKKILITIYAGGNI